MIEQARTGGPCSWQNGFVESFNGKLRDELLNREWFRTRAEAKVLIERWRQFYNEPTKKGSGSFFEAQR